MKYKKYYIGIAILMIALLSIICLDFHSPKSKLFRSMLKRGVDIFFESEGDWNYSPWYFQLRSKLGLFSTLNTTSIIFSDLDLSEFDFNELRIIHEEYHVCLRRTNITDSQLKTICQFKNIIALDFAGCKYITDEGIREIANLESLQWLDISDTNCADYDVVLLKDIPNLKQLYLNHTHVSGSCFGTNDGWKSLKVLTLHGCKLNDDIFDTLANTNLYSLNICNISAKKT